MTEIWAASFSAAWKCAAMSCRFASPRFRMHITESVSPYTTLLPGISCSTMALVCWIMSRPVAVTLAAMGTHGMNPVDAPQKPYTEFMVTLNAS